LALAGATLSTREPVALEYTAGELRVKGLNLTRANLEELGAQARQRSVALRLDGDSLVLSPSTTRVGSP
jgi:general secretion pathway protein L